MFDSKFLGLGLKMVEMPKLKFLHVISFIHNLLSQLTGKSQKSFTSWIFVMGLNLDYSSALMLK